MMRSSLRAALIGLLAMLPAGCSNEAVALAILNAFWQALPGTPGCDGSTLEFLDVATGEPVGGAPVDWAAADPEDLVDLSVEQYLDTFGEPIGVTNDAGGLYFPVCGLVEVVNPMLAVLVPSHELTLIRLHSTSVPVTFQFRHVLNDDHTDPGLTFLVDGTEIRVTPVHESVYGDYLFDNWRDLVSDRNDYP